jgi:hypothetical protein
VVTALATVLVALAFVAVRFLTPTDASDVRPGEVRAGKVDEYASHTVTYLPDQGVFVVNWGRGLRAIDEDPSQFRMTEGACDVRYVALRPSPSSPERGVIQGDLGHFKSDCEDTYYSWWRGEDMSRWGEYGLYHYEVNVRGDDVFIDMSARRSFSWWY